MMLLRFPPSSQLVPELINTTKGNLNMKVQPIHTHHGIRFIVLDDSYTPIQDINRYLKYLDNVGKSPNTQRSYAYALCSFYRFMAQEKIHVLELCSNPDYGPIDILGKFVLWLQYPDYVNGIYHVSQESCVRSDRTVNHTITVVLQFYEYLAANNLIQSLDVYRAQMVQPGIKPFLCELVRTRVRRRSSILKKAVEKKPVAAISREEYTILFSLAKNRRDRLLLALLFEGGLRLNEALGIHISDLSHIEDNVIYIVARENNQNFARVKNHAEGTIYLPDYVIDLLLEYLNEDVLDFDSDFLFLNLYGKEKGSPLKDNAVEQMFLRLSNKAGIKVHPHMLRHGFAQEKLEAGWEIQEVQAYLRHKHPTTTEIYAHYTDAIKLAKMQNFINQQDYTKEWHILNDNFSCSLDSGKSNSE